jgi:hypothetical protein
MFITTSKQTLAKYLQARNSLAISYLAATQAMTPLISRSQFAFRSNNYSRQATQIMGNFSNRGFALPSHIVCEMPNLSPTMEKVRRVEKG